MLNDLVNKLTEAKIRVAKAECTMAMSFGPVCGSSPSPMAYPVPRRRRPLSCGAIALSGRRGEGHAVAVFCVEGPLRGRRFSAARQRISGSARYPTLNFASLASRIEGFD
jgi:hypothetical protein